MTQAESVKLLCDLFQTGKGTIAGNNFKLFIGPDNDIYLEGSNKDEVVSLTSHLELVLGGLKFRSNSTSTNFSVAMGPDQAKELVKLLQHLKAGTIDAEITKQENKIDYDKFKAMAGSVNRNFKAAVNKLADPKYTTYKQDATTLMDLVERNVNERNRLAQKLKAGTASPAEIKQFHDLLSETVTLVDSLKFAKSELEKARSREMDLTQKGYLTAINNLLIPQIEEMNKVFDVTSPVGKVVKAISVKKFYEDLKALALTEEAKKKALLSAKLFEAALDPRNPNPFLKRIIKDGDISSFDFCAKAPDSSEFYIQCNSDLPKEIKDQQIVLIHHALEKDMNRNIGRIDPAGKIVLTPAEAQAVSQKYGRLALPKPGAGTRVAPIVPPAGGPPAPGPANPKFDLFKAANQTALKTAVETKLNLKWDATNPASIRIYKDGEDAKKSIYLQKATNSLETTSTDPEVYGRMANLMKELMPSAPGAEGITAVEITNGTNDAVELAKIAKEMLDKGLGVKVDLTAKGAVRALDEATFIAALKRIGGPAGGDALVQKYQDKKNELEPRRPGPAP